MFAIVTAIMIAVSKLVNCYYSALNIGVVDARSPSNQVPHSCFDADLRRIRKHRAGECDNSLVELVIFEA